MNIETHPVDTNTQILFSDLLGMFKEAYLNVGNQFLSACD